MENLKSSFGFDGNGSAGGWAGRGVKSICKLKIILQT